MHTDGDDSQVGYLSEQRRVVIQGAAGQARQPLFHLSHLTLSTRSMRSTLPPIVRSIFLPVHIVSYTILLYDVVECTTAFLLLPSPNECIITDSLSAFPFAVYNYLCLYLVLARVQAFLPQMEAANADLLFRAQANPQSVNIEHLDSADSQFIQMVRSYSCTSLLSSFSFPFSPLGGDTGLSLSLSHHPRLLKQLLLESRSWCV